MFGPRSAAVGSLSNVSWSYFYFVCICLWNNTRSAQLFSAQFDAKRDEKKITTLFLPKASLCSNEVLLLRLFLELYITERCEQMVSISSWTCFLYSIFLSPQERLSQLQASSMCRLVGLFLCVSLDGNFTIKLCNTIGFTSLGVFFIFSPPLHVTRALHATLIVLRSIKRSRGVFGGEKIGGKKKKSQSTQDIS